jgi:glycosyltransferase involved in cell wall biosynthesis
MMRLLFCESSPGFGGQESQILLQMEALEVAGHRVHLACPADSRLAMEAGRRGLPWAPVSFRNSLHVASILHVRNLLIQQRMDAVICHSGHDANVAAIAARLSGRRRIRVLRIRTYLAARVRPLTVNFLADRTLTPSNFLREKIIKSPRIKSERVGVLRPIVPVEQLSQQAREPLDSELSAWLDAHSPILVHAAMLRGHKGHRMVLDALEGLKATFPNIGYVMAGFGTRESELRHLVASKHLTPHAFFAGMVSPVAPLLKRANVVIMPSTKEPLGLAQMEALALGVPVAVSNVGGLPETVTDQKTGRIFPQGDVGAWILGLTEMLNSPETNLLQAKVGKIFVEENFSAAAHVVSLLRHLKEIGVTR